MPNFEQVWIDYTNHRGERRWRAIEPTEMTFGETEYHTVQWLLGALDVERGVHRWFAMRDIHAWRDTPPDATPTAAERTDGE